MDREIRDRLRECLREFTACGDIEASLAGQARANEIRPYLGVAAALQEDACRLPPGSPQRSGREQLLSALQATTHRGGVRMGILQLGFVRAGAAAVVGLLFIGGVAGGVSAVAGGPDLAGAVVHAVTGINHAPDQAETGKEHANPNASEGADNAGQGSGNASDTGQQHANPAATFAASADGNTSGSSIRPSQRP
jgi:hypothetical protein